MIHHKQRAIYVLIGGMLATTATASGSVIGIVGPNPFPGSPVITFSELPIGTPIPFSIGIMSVVGVSGSIRDDGLPEVGLTPSPSSPPYLESATIPDDVIDIRFSTPLLAFGTFFNVKGSSDLIGELILEAFAGEDLLTTLPAIPDFGTAGGFIGVMADSPVITRVVLRDVDPSSGVSFRLDDVTFTLPEPGTLSILLPFLLFTRRCGRKPGAITRTPPPRPI